MFAWYSERQKETMMEKGIYSIQYLKNGNIVEVTEISKNPNFISGFEDAKFIGSVDKFYKTTMIYGYKQPIPLVTLASTNHRLYTVHNSPKQQENTQLGYVSTNEFPDKGEKANMKKHVRTLQESYRQLNVCPCRSCNRSSRIYNIQQPR